MLNIKLVTDDDDRCARILKIDHRLMLKFRWDDGMDGGII